MQKFIPEEKMLPLHIFSQLGLFVVPDFLDSELRTKSLAEARKSAHERSTITRKGVDNLLDEEVRKSHWIGISKKIISAVEAKLEALRPRLEEHFGLRLSGCEKIQF